MAKINFVARPRRGAAFLCRSPETVQDPLHLSLDVLLQDGIIILGGLLVCLAVQHRHRRGHKGLYRQAGAAMSLYAKAAELAAKRGYKRLCGRISTANTPVANLYAFLGASFEKPCDIFLKEAAK